MAGPGIRAWEFASALSGRHSVTLAVPNATKLTPHSFQMVRTPPRAGLASMVRASDVVICQGPRLMPGLLALVYNRPVVVDLYDPYNIEELEASCRLPLARRRERQRRVGEIINLQLLFGDFFICASERQRDYWLGALSANHRLNPKAYDADNRLRNLIDVVPFGIPATPPRRGNGAIKGRLPGIAKDDFVVLWAGGLWGWLDPLAVIRAMAIVRDSRPDVKLVFMGTRHPNPGVGRPEMVDQAIALADELGLRGSSVVFNEGWVPYLERDLYLTAADVGVSAQHEHLETRFAFRTRLLDYLWAELPIIATSGDNLGDAVQSEGLGIAVSDSDVNGIAAAILRMRNEPEFRAGCRRRISGLSSRYRWDSVTRPLANYCDNPSVAWRVPLQVRLLLATRIACVYASIKLDRDWGAGS